MVACFFRGTRARSVSLALLVLVFGLANTVSAQSAEQPADSLYKALSSLPLDSLSASQYLWLQEERGRRQRPVPVRPPPTSQPFSSAWDKAARPVSASGYPIAQQADLSGPRFGFTILSDGVIKKLKDESIDVGSVVTQFGWQVEKRFYASENGNMGVTEWVLLVGGLEQSVALPSVTWLVGMRTKTGAEFGVGPNVTPLGAALAIAAGVTYRTGALNLPVNLAVVPSKSGVRVSLLAGFNLWR